MTHPHFDMMDDEHVHLLSDDSLMGKRIRCRECGKRETLKYNGAVNAHLNEYKLCHTCDFWTHKIDWDPQNVVRVEGEHYHIGDDTGPFRGHGGRQFRIYFFDGRVVETNNLWSQGEIPEHFRDRLPDNARFIQSETEWDKLMAGLDLIPRYIELKDYLKEHHQFARFINWELPITICRSAAGYYIGMLDHDNSPIARFSEEYWATQEDAQFAFESGNFTIKLFG